MLGPLKNKQRNGPKRRRLNTESPGEVSSTILAQGFSIPRRSLFGYELRTTVSYYATVNALTSGAGTAASYVFSANGLYDPDVSGTGGQPMGFDQAMLFYNHYTVHSSRIRAIVLSNNVSLRCIAALSVSGSSTAVTAYENLVENGDITLQLLNYAGATGSVATLRRGLNVAKFQAVRQVLDDPNMRGDVTANPVEQAYFHISVWNPTSISVAAVDAQVLLEYDVTFHEPRKAPLS